MATNRQKKENDAVTDDPSEASGNRDKNENGGSGESGKTSNAGKKNQKNAKIRFSRKDVRGHNDALQDMGRARTGGSFEPRLKQRFHKRIVALLAVFCLIIGVYAMNLIALQAAGNAYSVYDPPGVVTPAYTKTVTLQAPRGEIYDRNGTKLVTNATSYAVRLDYDTFYAMGSVEQRNRTLLTLHAALDEVVQQSQDRRVKAQVADELFPFDGTYPSLTLNEAAKTAGSETYLALRQTLEYLGMPYTTASQIVQYYVTVYALDAHSDGIPLYTAEEITTLIHLYYNMDRLNFSPDTSYCLATGIDNTALVRLQALNIAGLRADANQTRLHLYEGYASHVLGELVTTEANDTEFCNALGYPVNEVKGKNGCEGAFDDYLQGEDGEMIVTYDSDGNILSCEVIKDALPGQDVYLTMDISLQIAAEDALRVNVNTVANTGTAMAGIDCDAGAVIAMDPATGEILAMGSYPTYYTANSQHLAEYQDSSAYSNRATGALTAPGSLFHICTSLAALDGGTVTADELLRDDGILQTDGVDVYCPLYENFLISHEQLTISTALTDGCHVFFGKLGNQLGIRTLSSWAAALGLGQATGIEIAEEIGTLPDADLKTSPALAAIGQGKTQSTPLQLCSMLATLIQNGTRYRAHLFQDSRSYVSGTILQMSNPQILSTIHTDREDTTTILAAMQEAARANTLLSSHTAALNEQGITIGCLGTSSLSGTMNSSDALLLAYGTERTTNRSIAVCVLLEHGAKASLASPTAAAVLNTYFAP